MVGMLAVAVVLQLLVPAYGMTAAAWLVFMGVLNYVAYRDILERRPGNPSQAERRTRKVGSAEVKMNNEEFLVCVDAAAIFNEINRHAHS
jgi:hypothetical protein